MGHHRRLGGVVVSVLAQRLRVQNQAKAMDFYGR
jgi:hypothetical protein